MATTARDTPSSPTPVQIRRWRRYLADELAEAASYRDLAERRSGEEREILLALAAAEGRHEEHWRELLGAAAEPQPRPDLRTRLLGFLTRQFGSVFVLALIQRAEARSPYADDDDATEAMAADERIHGEVVRGLAERGRNRLSGTFRAAVFGANDGLVSNLALVLGVGASGVGTGVVLFTGIAGLLAGALSMGAGEFVSVRSQRELLSASSPDLDTNHVVPDLDVDANELSLVYRARGLSQEDADARAARVFAGLRGGAAPTSPITIGGVKADPSVDEYESIGTGMGAALSSFCFFASGAIIPVLPYLLGMSGLAAVILASVLVGLALLATGAIVGLLSGAPPLARALRQLGIGYGAALVTYLLGLLFGASGV
ncbi:MULTISPECIES: VIT1/CCC1 transporter family protein [unclassified Rathayibacter]|uniref:VIT1/CCC1 transporter family protein n=1 Tax=unclassified Rathayibacter TaxID=2609250 RepID=UPI000F4B5D2E|nr:MULTISPECIES: VIT1/CCC1 transporter family protein [unclassified Rathayibacter]ROP57176.1 VIT1/CCC1 family predicted Fe2+/Mn2+ transporter [Rathayibacter sp. PhB186]ROS55561.1 VIT1/CCC1 family predicted Fe2+/Mn2+ transporter [Rathayibacter sp. PhB185]